MVRQNVKNPYARHFCTGHRVLPSLQTSQGDYIQGKSGLQNPQKKHKSNVRVSGTKHLRFDRTYELPDIGGRSNYWYAGPIKEKICRTHEVPDR